MRVKIPLAIVIVLAAAVGYLMGTDSGRPAWSTGLEKMRCGCPRPPLPISGSTADACNGDRRRPRRARELIDDA